MKQTTEPTNDEGLAIGGSFYQCDNGAECGLRFPVGVNDSFAHRCPRCRGTVHLVARVESTEMAGVDPLRRSTQPPSQVRLLLDNWRSTFNVGSAFRTADGAGLGHIYLCGISATPESQRKLVKTALGAETFVAWSYHRDAVQLATQLQAGGAQLWVLERNAHATSLFDIRSLPEAMPVVLAAGNEVVGVDPGLTAVADQVIELPMLGNKQSLNVAVALSITTYWLRAKEMAHHQRLK